MKSVYFFVVVVDLDMTDEKTNHSILLGCNEDRKKGPITPFLHAKLNAIPLTI